MRWTKSVARCSGESFGFMYGRFEVSCAIEVETRNTMHAVATANMNFPEWLIYCPGGIRDVSQLGPAKYKRLLSITLPMLTTDVGEDINFEPQRIHLFPVLKLDTLPHRSKAQIFRSDFVRGYPLLLVSSADRSSSFSACGDCRCDTGKGAHLEIHVRDVHRAYRQPH